MIRKSIVLLLLSASVVRAGDSCFPLATGNRWTYRSTFLISVTTFAETVVEEKTIGNDSYFIFDNFRLQASVPFRQEGLKVFTVVDGTRYTMYDFSAEAGASWTAPDPPSTLTGRMTLMGKADSVLTPAGVFSGCFHFRHALSGNVTFDEWFAPGAGLVKRVSRLMSGQIESVLVESRVVSAVPSGDAADPSGYALHGNYPNPFNASTVISFDAPRDGRVKLLVYDCLGRPVAGLFDGPCPEGSHSVSWNPIGRASGVYFIRMTSGRFARTRKAILQN
jgi:hypothetical protein